MREGSRLAVIGISNTHDLDSRVLPRIARWGRCVCVCVYVCLCMVCVGFARMFGKAVQNALNTADEVVTT